MRGLDFVVCSLLSLSGQDPLEICHFVTHPLRTRGLLQ